MQNPREEWLEKCLIEELDRGTEIIRNANKAFNQGLTIGFCFGVSLMAIIMGYLK